MCVFSFWAAEDIRVYNFSPLTSHHWVKTQIPAFAIDPTKIPVSLGSSQSVQKEKREKSLSLSLSVTLAGGGFEFLHQGVAPSKNAFEFSP